jgi:hypothetical protein
MVPMWVVVLTVCIVILFFQPEKSFPLASLKDPGHFMLLWAYDILFSVRYSSGSTVLLL